MDVKHILEYQRKTVVKKKNLKQKDNEQNIPTQMFVCG